MVAILDPQEGQVMCPTIENHTRQYNQQQILQVFARYIQGKGAGPSELIF